MSNNPRAIVEIEHDDYHAKHVRWTADGRQFFLTNPFVPAYDGKIGGEFIALYIFDGDGKLLDATIDELGPRSSFDREKAKKLYEQRLKELGKVHFRRIRVVPFSLTRFGIEFGLVLRVPETDEDPWAVEALPGNYMAFFEPWDSGEYDT